MDASGALLAIDELAKWRERKRRVEQRLLAERERKQSLLRDLETVQARIAELETMLGARPGDSAAPPPSSPPTMGVIR